MTATPDFWELSDGDPISLGKGAVVRPDDAFRGGCYTIKALCRSWRIVQAFMAADGEVPKEVALPGPHDREVARILFERRQFTVLDVIEAIAPFGQPELLDTDRKADLQSLSGEVLTDMMVSPLPRVV